MATAAKVRIRYVDPVVALLRWRIIAVEADLHVQTVMEGA